MGYNNQQPVAPQGGYNNFNQGAPKQYNNYNN